VLDATPVARSSSPTALLHRPADGTDHVGRHRSMASPIRRR
jgi:hypothetical protein